MNTRVQIPASPGLLFKLPPSGAIWVTPKV